MSACSGSRPADLGVVDGTLAPCPETPNCVHTGLRHPDGTRPFSIRPGTDSGDVMAAIREVLAEMPRTVVVTEDERYLHAEATSLIFRFVDDLEFLIKEEELIVRSASRVGRSDMGVNGRRVERVREGLRHRGVLRQD